MTALRNAFLVGLFVFIAFGVLNPNPFANNPDIIWDESYFLTSALSAIENKTLPGWDFPSSGAYYGGPQVYVDTLVLIPVLGAVIVHSDFSLAATKIWVAQNTGELLHILRLVSGASALLLLLFCFFWFKKKRIPYELALTLTLFLFLLLSNVLVIEFLHTAKVWPFYILLVAVPSAVLIANEYYLSRLKMPFMEKNRYLALLIWSGVAVFFQSYICAFSSLLLLVYALILGHVQMRDIGSHVRKYWWLMVAVSLTQISFMYRAYALREQFAGISTTVEGAIDWSARLVKPLIFAVQTQPLVLLYPLGLILGLAIARRHPYFDNPRKRAIIAIAATHPILTYLFFHVIVGFDILPRYAIMLTLACAFSTAILMSEIGKRAVVFALACSAALFLVVNMHAIALYSQPSSETVLLRTIMQKFNTPDTVFIVDHSARRMTLPVNAESLSLLDEERRAMSRFAFLLQNRDRLPVSEFKPLTAIAYRAEQEAAYLAQFSTGTYSVWMIRRLCTDRCGAQDIQAGTCFEINIKACGIEPQEPNTLPVFLSATQLGYSYIVRKIR